MTVAEWQRRLAEAVSRWTQPTSSNGHPPSKPMILLIDDEPELTQVIAYRLLANGYDVMTAISGEDALEKMARQRPDAIVLDILLPGLDGNQVAECLQHNAQTRTIPVLFLTSLAQQEEVERNNYRMGDRFMLSKPFTTEQLLGLLERVLAS